MSIILVNSETREAHKFTTVDELRNHLIEEDKTIGQVENTTYIAQALLEKAKSSVDPVCVCKVETNYVFDPCRIIVTRGSQDYDGGLLAIRTMRGYQLDVDFELGQDIEHLAHNISHNMLFSHSLTYKDLTGLVESNGETALIRDDAKYCVVKM